MSQFCVEKLKQLENKLYMDDQALFAAVAEILGKEFSEKLKPKLMQHALKSIKGKSYIKGAFKQEINLLGNKIELITVPYLQQDPFLGSCATAAGWVASQIIYHRFGANKHPYFKITEQSIGDNFAVGDPIQSPGLTAEQLCKGLRQTGATVKNLRSKKANEMKELVYIYTESNLPTILCFTEPGKEVGHAVINTGHFLPDKFKDAPSELAELTEKRNLYSVSQWVDKYYAHDDRYGPFSRLYFLKGTWVRIQEKSIYKLKLDSYPQDFIDEIRPKINECIPLENILKIAEKDQVSLGNLKHEWKKYFKELYCPIKFITEGTHNITYNLDNIIVVTPSYCRNQPLKKLKVSTELFAYLCELVKKKYIEGVRQEKLSKEEELKKINKYNDFFNSNFMLRMLLVETNHFKNTLPSRIINNEKDHKEFIKQIRMISLPKYAWLVECSFKSEKEREVIGSFLFDSTIPTHHPKVIIGWFLRYVITRNAHFTEGFALNDTINLDNVYPILTPYHDNIEES